jgi:hypothetical protein
MVRMRASTPDGVVAEITEAVLARGNERSSVAIDGAEPAAPDDLADRISVLLKENGRPTVRIAAEDFLRPASLRLEFGHHDVDAFYRDWLDLDGLRREVFDRWRRTGECRVLPALRDRATDRSPRADYVDVPERAVLLLDGNLLLGNGFPLDLTVHLALSTATLERRLREQWTLPAFERYRAEVDPERTADITVRSDHPDRPAISSRARSTR